MTNEIMQQVKEFAEQNWVLDDDDENRIFGEHEEFAVTNPWIDCSGRFQLTDVDAVKEWGLITVIDFIEKAQRRINETQTAELPNSGWIPLKTRPMTEEEMTFYRDWAEYEAEIFDCPLPEDGQEVLVSYGGYVCVDTFVKDDGCYFEGVDIEDVDAWMPLPDSYKAESEE